MTRALHLLVVATAALAGCRLIDQRTFERAGLYAPPPHAGPGDFASAVRPPEPLAIIRFGGNDADWQPPLLAAARAAQTRKASVQFDLVAPVPIAAAPALQAQAVREGGEDAAAVARVLQADGVPAEAIHLGQRGDAGNPPRQIEIYVR